MRSAEVLFLVEHVARELDVAACLAARLKSQFGIEADIRPYYLDFERNLAQYNPRVVVFPFFYGADVTHPTGYLARWPQAEFLNLAWEQILMEVDIRVKTPRDAAARQQVYHLCWSTAYRDFLIARGVAPERLPITGNPVFKLYDLPYRAYFEPRQTLARRHGIDPDRKWILFPESYQYAFMHDSQLRSLIDTQNADGRLLEEARRYSERNIRQLFVWMKELDARDDPVFIFRPRPSTPPRQAVDVVRRIAGGPLRNVAVVKAGSVREWILAADHVMSSHSTTLIEAALAGKATHLFSPEPIPPALSAEWHGLVPVLKDKDSFLGALREYPVAATAAPLAAWARSRFETGDPITAIAALIVRLLDKSRTRERAPLPRAAAFTRMAYEAVRKFRPRSRFDAFGSREAARCVARWERVLAD